VLLRTWESDDASDAFAIWGDAEVMRFVDEPLADLVAARRTLQRAAAAQESHGVSLWAVVEKASGEVIGACGFHFVADGPELELAYHFKRTHWGRGFATEAARVCVGHAAKALAATRITAGVEIGNVASRRVLDLLRRRLRLPHRSLSRSPRSRNLIPFRASLSSCPLFLSTTAETSSVATNPRGTSSSRCGKMGLGTLVLPN
jgi:ribosomal-protein-alanine N-acetyltransferase